MIVCVFTDMPFPLVDLVCKLRGDLFDGTTTPTPVTSSWRHSHVVCDRPHDDLSVMSSTCHRFAVTAIYPSANDKSNTLYVLIDEISTSFCCTNRCLLLCLDYSRYIIYSIDCRTVKSRLAVLWYCCNISRLVRPLWLNAVYKASNLSGWCIGYYLTRVA